MAELFVWVVIEQLKLMVVKNIKTKNIHAIMLGHKGGKARAKKYPKEKLSEWAKKGGRPRLVGHLKVERIDKKK